MNKTTAAVVGFLVAPVVPAVVGAVMSPITAEGPDVYSVLGFTVLFYPFSLAGAFVFGVPAFFLLRHYRILRWWSTLLVGLVTGALMAIVLRLPSVVATNDLIVMSPMGGASALTFWLIWKLGREPEASQQ